MGSLLLRMRSVTEEGQQTRDDASELGRVTSSTALRRAREGLVCGARASGALRRPAAPARVRGRGGSGGHPRGGAEERRTEPDLQGKRRGHRGAAAAATGRRQEVQNVDGDPAGRVRSGADGQDRGGSRSRVLQSHPEWQDPERRSAPGPAGGGQPQQDDGPEGLRRRLGSRGRRARPQRLPNPVRERRQRRPSGRALPGGRRPEGDPAEDPPAGEEGADPRHGPAREGAGPHEEEAARRRALSPPAGRRPLQRVRLGAAGRGGQPRRAAAGHRVVLPGLGGAVVPGRRAPAPAAGRGLLRQVLRRAAAEAAGHQGQHGAGGRAVPAPAPAAEPAGLRGRRRPSSPPATGTGTTSSVSKCRRSTTRLSGSSLRAAGRLGVSRVRQVESLYARLSPDADKMTQLMVLGFSEREARLGLRASRGDVQEAASLVGRRRREREELRRRERQKRKKNKESLAVLAEAGYGARDAAAALRRANGDLERAFQILLDASQAPPTCEANLDQKLQQLLYLGFERSAAEAALASTGGDLQSATELLIDNWGAGPSEAAPPSEDEEPGTSSGSADDSELVNEVLEDIPGDEDDYLDPTLEEELQLLNAIKTHLARSPDQ
ncbi:NEDD8 ultimate buster 1 isoform X2 [Syngnathoides biaculeatus]|uniref:NEDD8 ultimate buster 1 isoform X2 n=1 Tax=Syngnathoides biaculeatus TaxID=300417 RepID=UPI002ADD9E68|nr:NEDD8 ultimate buster 1 isoform X2 [Syngnathoides biaculeatus]